jgi:hypothetical protein
VHFWGKAPAIIPYDVRDDSVTADILRPLSVGRIMTDKPSFHCPNCNALYQVVKVEAGPETAYRAINCRACGAPLPPSRRQVRRQVFSASHRRTHSALATTESEPPIKASSW